MEKITNALSNEVYRDGNKIIKIYTPDLFKRIFGNQEDIGLVNNGIHFETQKNKIIMDFIESEKFSLSENYAECKKFILWLKEYHKKTSIEGLDYPKFGSAYVNVLNPKKKGFMKKNNYWPNEEGYLRDALTILHNGKPVFLHNDLVDGNILKVDGDYKLIDFEYSGKGNPIFDVASFITERNFTMAQSIELAKLYDKDMNMFDFWIVCAFLQAFWARWAFRNYTMKNMIIYKDIFDWKYNRYFEIIRNT